MIWWNRNVTTLIAELGKGGLYRVAVAVFAILEVVSKLRQQGTLGKGVVRGCRNN